MADRQTRISDREWYNRFKDKTRFGGTHNNASFKGVPFIIDDADTSFGRRTIEHEYPLQDVPYSEDLGREARHYIISGILLGDDYLSQRDNLINAVEEKGPGELIHPYYGVLNVICKKLEVMDTRIETRVCTFQITLTEVGNKEFVTTLDTGARVEEQFETSFANNKTFFEKVYGAVNTLAGYKQGLNDTYIAAMNEIEKAKQVANMPSEFVRRLKRAQANAEILLASSTDLWNTIVDVVTFGFVNEFADEDIDRRKSFWGLADLLSFDPDVSNKSTDSEIVRLLIQESALITMCLISSQIEYISTDEAKSYQTTILNKIDDLLLGDVSDQKIQDYRDLRKVVYQDITERSINLPRVVEYQPKITLPALVVSYTLYGTVEFEQDIINRNNKFYAEGAQGIPITYGIQHPGFVPGGEILKVLLNA